MSSSFILSAFFSGREKRPLFEAAAEGAAALPPAATAATFPLPLQPAGQGHLSRVCASSK